MKMNHRILLSFSQILNSMLLEHLFMNFHNNIHNQNMNENYSTTIKSYFISFIHLFSIDFTLHNSLWIIVECFLFSLLLNYKYNALQLHFYFIVRHILTIEIKQMSFNYYEQKNRWTIQSWIAIFYSSLLEIMPYKSYF